MSENLLFVLTRDNEPEASPSHRLLAHCENELGSYFSYDSRLSFREHFVSIHQGDTTNMEECKRLSDRFGEALKAGQQSLIFDDGCDDPLLLSRQTFNAPVISLCDFQRHSTVQSEKQQERLVLEANPLSSTPEELLAVCERKLRSAGEKFVLVTSLKVLSPQFAPTYEPAGHWTSRELMMITRDLLRWPWSAVVIEDLGSGSSEDDIAQLSAAAIIRAVMYTIVSETR